MEYCSLKTCFFIQNNTYSYKCNTHGKIHKCPSSGEECPLEFSIDGGYCLCKISGRRVGDRVILSKSVSATTTVAPVSEDEEDDAAAAPPTTTMTTTTNTSSGGDGDGETRVTDARRNLFYSLVDRIFTTDNNVSITNAYVSELLRLWGVNGNILKLKTHDFVIGTLYLMKEYDNAFLRRTLPHPGKLKRQSIDKRIITIAKKKWRRLVGDGMCFRSHEEIIKVEARVSDQLLVRLSKDI